MVLRRGFLLKAFFIVVGLFSASGAALAQGSWTVIKRGASGDLVSVFFTTEQRGFVGGDGGYLALTNDGGRNWSKQPLNTTENVNEIYFRNDDNGYLLAGRRIYKSNDKGNSWRETRVLNQTEFRNLVPDFLSMRFIDKRRGWIVGSVANQKEEVVDSLVLQSVDSGETWQRVLVPAKNELYSVDFADDLNGWIVGDGGLILRTTDGGLNWAKQSSGVNVSLYCVDFRDSQTGVAVGGKGIILRTENGGATWVKIGNIASGSLLRVNFVSDKLGWIVGAGGIIMRSEDKGRTWIRQNSQTTDSFYGLYMDKKGGWAVGRKGLIARYNKE